MILHEISKKNKNNTKYPFNVINFDILSFTNPVTFFTGDNGSGKSTLLRIIKDLANAIDIGNNRKFEEKISEELTKVYKLSWSLKSKRGFYLQSEDFYNYISWTERESIYYEEELQRVEKQHENKEGMGYILESGLHTANRNKLERNAKEIGDASHGEGYLAFFKSRLRDNSLYLLDEPETPLSFHNQLAFLTMIQEAVTRGCQFIICTHSPVILAYPLATIYLFNKDIMQVSYENHPLVTSMKSFLSDPERFMYYLFEENN